MGKTNSDKAAISEAFKQLRSLGFFAAEDFHCCQSCAWRSVPAEAANVVFYHEQDGNAFDDDGKLRSPLYLAHNGNAALICSVIASRGFEVKWDGSEKTRIAVLPGREVHVGE